VRVSVLAHPPSSWPCTSGLTMRRLTGLGRTRGNGRRLVPLRALKLPAKDQSTTSAVSAGSDRPQGATGLSTDALGRCSELRDRDDDQAWTALATAGVGRAHSTSTLHGDHGPCGPSRTLPCALCAGAPARVMAARTAR
jgi:hypothetical protein